MSTPKNILWMGDIHPWMDDIFIKNSFIAFGFKPLHIKIIKSVRDNKAKYFCLVHFTSFLEANEALLKLNRKKIPNTNLFFKLNLPKNNFENEKIAYVGNLPKYVNDNELYHFFKSRYPTVYYACIMSDQGKSIGYGFVHFASKEEYNKCLNEMDGKIFHNKVMKVKVKTVRIETTNLDSLLQNKFDTLINYDNINIDPLNHDKKEELETQKNNFNLSNNYITNNLSPTSLSREEQKKIFLKNLKIIENNDIISLQKIIQENVNKIMEYYKKNKKESEIPLVVLYYSSSY